MEKFLDENISKQVRQVFENLVEPVEIMVFGKPTDLHYQQARQLLEEVAELSDLLTINIHDLNETPELGTQFGIDQEPTIILAGKNGGAPEDFGVRILGAPSGHEFSSLIHSLISVSQRKPSLQPETIAFLEKLEEPIRLKVFSTPT